MIGTILSSSISSKARAVFFGRLPGIFLLMKWITCSLIGALPTVAAGFCVCFFANFLRMSLPRRWALKPQSVITLRVAWMGAGWVALRKNLAAVGAGLNDFLP